MITIENFNGIHVLRDDYLLGGTKSVIIPKLLDANKNEYVYASPVYGAFQIALSEYCQSIGKRATIFCAKRAIKHPNTLKCIQAGANVVEVPYGYLSVVEKHARDYCLKTDAQKLVFGAHTDVAINTIADRMRECIAEIGKEPDEVWCAIGSGTLVEGILRGTDKAKINGVSVGAEYYNPHERLTIHKYPKGFEKESSYFALFQSMPNYDLKAWEFCNQMHGDGTILFWNVY